MKMKLQCLRMSTRRVISSVALYVMLGYYWAVDDGSIYFGATLFRAGYPVGEVAATRLSTLE